MISLSQARKMVMEIGGDDFPSVYTTLTLQDWANQNIISRLKVKNGKTGYPEIIVAEILTVLRLKNKYKLKEIAEAKCYLDLDCTLEAPLSPVELIKFINFKKTFRDKQIVINNSLEKIDCTQKVRVLADRLAEENKKLNIVSDYLDQFMEAKKEVAEYFGGSGELKWKLK
ncbi:hypothetical protein DFR79_10243 [Halanaerobium saccharolyticum]|uniref:Uncharacterized protein n=1 Tax=Halanaerobium saccharolyticum TaxID=43595 RepID=A0A4R6M436_9FIRM|nr:hypothetical protein [Halanaerobium saccharolyticum]TDO94669.1 hypothetical protein DFR79_10243 [Halanaerobium saccharolyticum]